MLECVPGTTSVHVYINKQTQSLCEQCNDAFEHSFMRNLTQASLISSHQCDEGGCEAQTGSVDPVEHGAMTAGVKLYIHKSKWQQSKGKVYADEEEDDEDEDV